MLVFSLFVVGANGFVADIDFMSQSQHSRSQAMSKYEMIAETELGSNGISSEVDDMNIESMSMNGKEVDAIVRRALNGNDGRCVKRTDHESVSKGRCVLIRSPWRHWSLSLNFTGSQTC